MTFFSCSILHKYQGQGSNLLQHHQLAAPYCTSVTHDSSFVPKRTAQISRGEERGIYLIN
uniref:Uncharacterized protein n=1 Tax=Anguilla anguilla TaxID=7936 RepID=A0A0E9QI18_ANGAN